MIDLNKERNVQAAKKTNNQIDFSTMSLSKIPKNNNNAAKLYIHTLSPYKGFGKGSYKMTALKKMTGTTDFLGMAEADRKCQLEVYEKCRLEAFFSAGEDCQCVPWELPNLFQVRLFFFKNWVLRMDPAWARDPSAFLLDATVSTGLRTRGSTAV